MDNKCTWEDSRCEQMCEEGEGAEMAVCFITWHL